MSDRKKILFATAEAVPFIKTGGLADVAGTLPKYFDKSKYDTRVILPGYECLNWKYKEGITPVFDIEMPFMGQNIYVGVKTAEYEGVTYYFIDSEYYFSGLTPYSNDGRWDVEKFTFFSRAVLSVLPNLGFRPDIIHCHDWQSALIPVYLKNQFQDNEFFRGIKTIMTIHNLKFQGVYGKEEFKRITGLGDEFMTDDLLGYYEEGNMMKGGILFSERITTVSNSYANEIKYPFYGEGLDGLMRAKESVLRGIVNGIDYDTFNPMTDKNLAVSYNVDTVIADKFNNKLALQKELGLPEDPRVMMIGIVSRLTDQKGFDLISYVMDEMCQDNVQFVILGTGTAQYEDMFRYFSYKYPEKVSANIYYSDPLSHKIYGSCDAFLMPSLFEPCGLSQLMSLRYGTLPIVRETGGLRDTVIPYNEYEGTGTGFSFANYNAHEMMNTVRYAEKIFYDQPENWAAMVKRAMNADFSWISSARQYEALYDEIL